jgi:hypothetical protein
MNLHWMQVEDDSGGGWTLVDLDHTRYPNRAYISEGPLNHVELWVDDSADWVPIPDHPTDLEECKAFILALVRMGSTQGEPHA